MLNIRFHGWNSLFTNLVGEGAGNTAEDEHNEDLDDGETCAGQQEVIILVVVMSVPELVVVARSLQQPPRQEVRVYHHHGQGFKQPQPRQHWVVLAQADHQEASEDETHDTFTDTHVDS